MNYDMLDLNGEQFQDEMLKELPARYTYLDGLETVIEQNWMEYGAYRPHRYLPALSISLNDQEGYVMPHGTILASVNLKDGYGQWESQAGIDTTGFQNMGIGFSGTLKNSIQGIYGYDRTLDGIVQPCNGTNAAITDYVSSGDVDIKRMLSTGVIAKTADINVTGAVTRPANQRPLGVIVHQVMRETSGTNMSYALSTAAYSVCRYGVLNIPYVLKDSLRINAPSKQPGSGDAGYTAVYWRHQFLLVTTPTLLGPEEVVRVDGNGKLILTTDSTTYPRQFGKIISWTNETFPALNAFVDGFPDLNVPGTNTGGLSRRLFDFVKRIREANGQTTTIADCVKAVEDGMYGMVKIMFNLAPIQ
jgi:hypothetical protein